MAAPGVALRGTGARVGPLAPEEGRWDDAADDRGRACRVSPGARLGGLPRALPALLREQFHAALRGKKTYLDKKDAARNPRLKDVFTFIDRNGDGKATVEELNAFLDLIDRGSTCFTVLSIGDRGQCLFELLDTNSDRQLSVREMRAAWSNVARWDANKDGSLAKDEVPRHLRVALCAGIPVRSRLFDLEEEPADTVTASKKAGPLWFQRMDVNGDGDVSRREWLGTDEDFRRIDTDGDGLISLDEAIEADACFRKKTDPHR